MMEFLIVFFAVLAAFVGYVAGFEAPTRRGAK
jgi:hypothetical protein